MQQADGKTTDAGGAIAPARDSGSPFAYHGVPQRRDRRHPRGPVGWISTPSGSYTRNQPDGASTWLRPTTPGRNGRHAHPLTRTDPSTRWPTGPGRRRTAPCPAGCSTTWDMAQPIAPRAGRWRSGRSSASTLPRRWPPMSSFVAANGTGRERQPRAGGQVPRLLRRLFGPFPFGACGRASPVTSRRRRRRRAGSPPARRRPTLAGCSAVRQHACSAPRWPPVVRRAAVTPARWQDVGWRGFHVRTLDVDGPPPASKRLDDARPTRSPAPRAPRRVRPPDRPGRRLSGVTAWPRRLRSR
jgi:hypothetical protein